MSTPAAPGDNTEIPVTLEQLKANPKVASEVTAWKDKIRAEAKASGGSEPSFREAMYAPVSEAESGTVSPMALPSGCGLFITVYKSNRWGNGSATSSSLTSCTTNQGTIRHDEYLYRLDWWGYNQRRYQRVNAYNTSSLGHDISDYCTTFDWNMWKGYTRGDIWTAGRWYYAEVWDYADFGCGGG